jgi:hypothetical protein
MSGAEGSTDTRRAPLEGSPLTLNGLWQTVEWLVLAFTQRKLCRPWLRAIARRKLSVIGIHSSVHPKRAFAPASTFQPPRAT